MPFTFWDGYQWHIIGVISICVVEAILITVLLIQRVKRRRTDERFRQVVETAPTGMLMVGRDGNIVMANAQVENLFGYPREELIGKPVELLLPEQVRGLHPTNRAGFFTAPEIHPTGRGRELFGRRKDGTEFPIEVGLSPLQTPRRQFVLASIIDLTERRRAEEGLRKSQRELQLLTGRLLEAQETERRRIARELHDDVNQCLALLVVEMELLAVSVPQSPAQIADRVRDLSARLKELSSSVHDLSHQLHPSKLEHVGLVVAVGALCKELTQSHSLEVKFTHYPDPGPVPQDTALCLYRIVQEALRNVIKHSGSHHASVELSGTANAICLKVTDDGIGFDLDAANEGLGLVSMRERLHLVGGQITIDSRPFGGTRIHIRVPLPAELRESVSVAHATEVSRGSAHPILEKIP